MLCCLPGPTWTAVTSTPHFPRPRDALGPELSARHVTSQCKTRLTHINSIKLFRINVSLDKLLVLPLVKTSFPNFMLIKEKSTEGGSRNFCGQSLVGPNNCRIYTSKLLSREGGKNMCTLSNCEPLVKDISEEDALDLQFSWKLQMLIRVDQIGHCEMLCLNVTFPHSETRFTKWAKQGLTYQYFLFILNNIMQYMFSALDMSVTEGQSWEILGK